MATENNPDQTAGMKAGCCIECGDPSITLVCVRCYVPDPARFRNVSMNPPDSFESDDYHARFKDRVKKVDYFPGRHWTDEKDKRLFGGYRRYDPRRASAADRYHNGYPFRREQTDDSFLDDE
jgi:hypothetical protein